MDEVIEHDLRIEDGHLVLPTAAGLGVDLNEEAAAALEPDIGEPPHWGRVDGSVQDW